MRILTRLLAVLVLLAVVGGGTWYVLFRSTPAKEVKRLQTKVEMLLDSNTPSDWEKVLDDRDRKWLEENKKKLEDKETRFDLARKAADRVLEIAGLTSVPHIQQRALIEERAGKPAEALKIYDGTAGVTRLPPHVHYHKAQLYLKLGQMDRAKAELLACADQFPYQANLLLGRIEMARGRAKDAKACYERALDFTTKEGDGAMSRVDPLSGIADTCNALLSMEKPDHPLATTWKRERGEALDEAIAIFEKKKPEAGAPHVVHFKRIADLYEASDDGDQLRKGIEIIEKAVTDSSGREHAAIHERLGQMRLALAEKGGDRAALVAAAEKDFERARQVVGSLTFDGVKEEDVETALTLRIANDLLARGEGWRLVDAEKDGKKDPLEIRDRLEKLSGEERPSESVRILLGLTLLRQGKDDEGEKKLLEVLEKAAPESRPAKAREIAGACRKAAPDSNVFLRFLKRSEEGANWRDIIIGSVPILHGAIEHWKKQGDDAKVAVLTAERDARIEAAEKAAGKSPEDLEFLSILASRYRGAPAAIDAMRKARDAALAEKPVDGAKVDRIRYRLAFLLLNEARRLEAEAAQVPEETAGSRPWMALSREALGEYLHLYKEYPFSREVQEAVIGIIRKFQAQKGVEELRLEDLVGPIVPKASKETAKAFADVLGSLAAGDVKGLSEKAKALEGKKELESYGSLVLSAVMAQEAEVLSREPAPDAEKKAAREAAVKTLRANAERILKAELEPMSAATGGDKEKGGEKGIVTLKLALLQVQIASLPIDVEKMTVEDVPDDLLKQLQGLAAGASKLPPSLAYGIYTLQAQAYLRRFNSLFLTLDSTAPREEGFDAGKTTKTAMSQLGARQSALRRAIEVNPDVAGPFMELAQTYTGIRSPASQPGTKYLIEPQYQNAVAIAKSAPESGAAETLAKLDFIAKIYEEGLGTPKVALEFRQRRLAMALGISEALGTDAFQDLIGCFRRMALGEKPDPEALNEAERTIVKFEENLPKFREQIGRPEFFKGFPVLAEKLRAMLAIDRIALNPLDTDRFRDEAIGHYRKLLAMGEDQKSPSLIVEGANNLAWYLAEGKRSYDEALTAVEKARTALKELPEEARKQLAPAVEDTAGFVLYQKQDFRKAEEVYRELIKIDSSPGYLFRYAQVLARMSKDAEALQAVKAAIDSEKDDKKLLKEAMELRDRLQLQLNAAQAGQK